MCALWREIAGDGNADHIPACGAGAEGAAVLWPMRCENQYLRANILPQMRGKTTVNTAADGTSITTISICAAVYADAAPTAIHLYAATCADVYAKGLCENQSRQHVASDRRHSEYRVLRSLWTIWRRHFVCVRFRFPVSDLLGLDDSNDGV